MTFAHKIAISAIVAVLVLVGGGQTALANNLADPDFIPDPSYPSGTSINWGTDCSAGTNWLVAFRNDDGTNDAGAVQCNAANSTWLFNFNYGATGLHTVVQTTLYNAGSCNNTTATLATCVGSGDDISTQEVCITDMDVCFPPPEPDVATSTPDSYPGIFFNGFLILMFGLFTPILMGRYIDSRGR